jgi:NAD(P)-dependent dehydrogenase (short-subunit alcohol dehydrogenase family)
MKEKTVLVTGANKGIGFGIAKHLGLSGWKVIIGARDEQRAEKAISELASAGVNVLGWVNIELRDLNNIEQAAKTISEKYPQLSLLVNNAGIPGDMSVDSEHTEISVIRETLEVNFIGTFALTKALIPLLAKNSGRIVNITVPSEISPYWHPLAYVASKAAQNAMMGVMAIEFQQKATGAATPRPSTGGVGDVDSDFIEIFSVHPGPTTTDLNGNMALPGFHDIETVGQKTAELINDGQNHQGEFIELYPIVEE